MTELERKIREVLEDPRWSLPAWPDAEARIRRTARRQRFLLSTALIVSTAGVVAAVLALVGVSDQSRNNRFSVVVPGTSAAPLGPTNGQVAYKCGNYICLMRPDGSDERTLTATTPEWDPAWSPDGTRLAFRGYYGPNEGDNAIYVVDADGCHLTRVAGATSGLEPSWSPGAMDQLAFTRTGTAGIQIAKVDGTGSSTLTTPTDSTDIEPTWSSANRIAFVRTKIGSSIGEIYSVRPDGSDLSAITSGGPGFVQPSWAPDSTQIAFVATTGGSTLLPGGPMVIQVANADGSERHAVTPSSWTSYDPTWTTNDQIMFLVQGASGTDAFVVNPDGSGLQKVYPNLVQGEQSVQIAFGQGELQPSACQ